ncbi:ABC-2 transporter permease [Methylomonas rapida]|uniref:Uncharacterized protein n=1 Tax=Methylomonas rapida TaxID=2963939 RepID=A0ABY7GFG4_9GAMM|nr:hypothetical protein [Methylomonas rapida]WAR43989.1 hypothetical protein NM686_016665 [Methylomonas rapida]
MLKAMLYAILGIFALGMLLFVAGFAGWQLGMMAVAGFVYPVAGKVILLAFASMLVVLIALLLQAMGRGLSIYFRREAVAMRRVSMLQIRQQDARQRLFLEKRQLHYQMHLKRQRLLAANDKKHRSQLFKVISTELQHHAAPGKRKALEKDLKHHHQQSNPQAMLALRAQLPCRS